MHVGRRCVGVGLLLGLHVLAARAIDAPAPAVPQQQSQLTAPPPVNVTPTDESQFYERLQYVTHKRNLSGLDISDAVLKSLGSADIHTAIGTLESQSVGNNRDATIALVRIQHWCSSVGSIPSPDPQAQLARLATVLPADHLPRIAGIFAAERIYRQKAQQGCSTAPFDYRGIESRLRNAAAAGDPASATALSQFVRDPAQRDALLLQAADQNYAPAQYALAKSRLIAVQRGVSTENVSSIRLLLKQAGRTLSSAKVDLANCMALACDGHPADAPAAAAFGTDAARDGEPMAFLSMMRMPWGARLTRTQLLAWQYFGARLNENGCTGDAYVQNVVFYTQTLSAMEKGVKPKVLEDAKAQADTLWQNNSARAMHEQGCG